MSRYRAANAAVEGGSGVEGAEGPEMWRMRCWEAATEAKARAAREASAEASVRNWGVDASGASRREE